MAHSTEPHDERVLEVLRERYGLDDERFESFELRVRRHYKKVFAQRVCMAGLDYLEELHETQEEIASELFIDRTNVPKIRRSKTLKAEHLIWILGRHWEDLDFAEVRGKSRRLGLMDTISFVRGLIEESSKELRESQFDRLERLFEGSLNGQAVETDLREWLDPYLFCLWIIDEAST